MADRRPIEPLPVDPIDPEPTTRRRWSEGVWPAWLVMFILALLLGWIPFIGPAIAGLAGGYLAGTVGAALVAAIIPSLVVALVAFLVGTLFGLPLVGVLVGTGALLVLLIGTIPLLLGAWLGGWMSERRVIG